MDIVLTELQRHLHKEASAKFEMFWKDYYIIRKNIMNSLRKKKFMMFSMHSSISSSCCSWYSCMDMTKILNSICVDLCLFQGHSYQTLHSIKKMKVLCRCPWIPTSRVDMIVDEWIHNNYGCHNTPRISKYVLNVDLIGARSTLSVMLYFFIVNSDLWSWV